MSTRKVTTGIMTVAAGIVVAIAGSATASAEPQFEKEYSNGKTVKLNVTQGGPIEFAEAAAVNSPGAAEIRSSSDGVPLGAKDSVKFIPGTCASPYDPNEVATYAPFVLNVPTAC